MENLITKIKSFILPSTTDEAFGVVVVRIDCIPPRILMVSSRDKGFWGFPKGHKEAGEKPIEAACRELFEETGVVCKPLPEPIFSASRFLKKDFRQVYKTNYFFLSFISHEPEVKIQESEIGEFTWATFDEAHILVDTTGYPTLKSCLQEIRSHVEFSLTPKS